MAAGNRTCHGFGFPNALGDSLQFAGRHLVPAPLAFNGGIETGQLGVLGVGLPVLILLRRWFAYRRLDARGDAKYRLPTEAEWEYAARAGGKTDLWAGTDDPDALDAHAWFIEDARLQVHPVGQKKPTEFGLFDMSGNVWQWTSDWYDARYYAKSTRQDPNGPKTGKLHALRGGYWGRLRPMLRVTRRIALPPDARGPGVGLRLVKLQVAVTQEARQRDPLHLPAATADRLREPP